MVEAVNIAPVPVSVSMDGLDVTSAGFEAQTLQNQDVDELLDLMNRCSKFFELVEGHTPSRDGVAQLIDERPESVPRERKLLIGLRRDGELSGVLEMLQGYPDAQTWYLGLLVFDPNIRRAGLGSAVYAATRRWAARNGACRIQLVVQESNPSALAFWRRMGFREIGRAVQQLEVGSNQVMRMAHEFDRER